MAGRIAETAIAWCLGAASLAYGFHRAWPFTIDDAGIVYAYAEHLASGQGLRAVSGGPVVEGYSDFLWVVLLAAFAKLGVAPPLAAKLLGALLLAWTGFAAGALVARLTPGSIASRALPAVLMGTCPEFVVWAPSGLENSLFSAALITALLLDVRESRDVTLTPFSALAVFAVSLTRPEGVLYAGVLGAFNLWSAFWAPVRHRQAARFLWLFLIPFAAYHAWHWVTFRSWVPNTFYAKSPGLSGFQEGFEYTIEGLVTTRMTFLIPLALAGVAAGRRASLPSAAFAAVSLAFAVYSRGDWMPHFRFVSTAFPMLAVLATTGLVTITRLTSRLTTRARVPELALAGVLLAAAVAWTGHQEARFVDARRLKWCHFCSRIEDALTHQRERDVLGLGAATYVTHDFGGPAYASTPSFMPLDLLGLADQSAALIEYARTKGDLTYDFARAQYFFHEQADYPTFLYFPDNFWKTLPEAPEFHLGYRQMKLTFPIEGKVVPETRLHLGAFVDYFPPVPAFRFESVFALRLIGAAAWRRGPREIAVSVSVHSVSETRASTLRLRASGALGPVHPLFGGNRSVARGISDAGPVTVVLSLVAPAGARPEDVIELGVGPADEGHTFAPLMTFAEVAAAPPATPRLPFPNNLPGTSDRELLQLGQRLRGLVDRRRDGRNYALYDDGLGTALLAAAKRARDEGRESDAYLGYVWAIQAEPDVTQLVYRDVFDLRREADQNAYLLEQVLLKEFYASGDSYWQLQLVAAYAAAKRWDKAEYFLDRLPRFEDEAWLREASDLRARVRSRDPSRHASDFAWTPLRGVASDFESEGSEGWTLGGGFEVRANDGQHVKPVWGIAGAGYLSTEGAKGPARAESAPFTIEGRALGFVLAGGDHPALRVELVVGGVAVVKAQSSKTRSFAPVLWDTTKLRGRTARLRLVDEADGTIQFLAVDDFRVWPFVEAKEGR